MVVGAKEDINSLVAAENGGGKSLDVGNPRSESQLEDEIYAWGGAVDKALESIPGDKGTATFTCPICGGEARIEKIPYSRPWMHETFMIRGGCLPCGMSVMS